MDAPTVISDPVWLAVVVALSVVVTLCGVLLAVSLGWMLGVRHRVKQAGARSQLAMQRTGRALGSFLTAVLGLVVSMMLWQWHPDDPFVATIIAFAALSGIVSTFIFVLAMADEIRRLRALHSGVKKRLKNRRY